MPLLNNVSFWSLLVKRARQSYEFIFVSGSLSGKLYWNYLPNRKVKKFHLTMFSGNVLKKQFAIMLRTKIHMAPIFIWHQYLALMPDALSLFTHHRTYVSSRNNSTVMVGDHQRFAQSLNFNGCRGRPTYQTYYVSLLSLHTSIMKRDKSNSSDYGYFKSLKWPVSSLFRD